MSNRGRSHRAPLRRLYRDPDDIRVKGDGASRPERIRLLAARGWSETRIADYLNCSDMLVRSVLDDNPQAAARAEGIEAARAPAQHPRSVDGASVAHQQPRGGNQSAEQKFKHEQDKIERRAERTRRALLPAPLPARRPQQTVPVKTLSSPLAGATDNSADIARRQSRAHVEMLRKRGGSVTSIARATGLRPESVCDMLGLPHAFARV